MQESPYSVKSQNMGLGIRLDNLTSSFASVGLAYLGFGLAFGLDFVFDLGFAFGLDLNFDLALDYALD